MKHFEAALKVIRPSSTKDVMKWYEDFARSMESISRQVAGPRSVPVSVRTSPSQAVPHEAVLPVHGSRGPSVPSMPPIRRALPNARGNGARTG